jgi:prepilin-type N-terminal cleavage/methylation domain-containing protein
MKNHTKVLLGKGGKKKFKSQKGITLLELIIAMAIFAVAVISAVEIFQMALQAQRSALSAKNLQENMRYAFEIINKEIRMAYRNDGAGNDFVCPNPSTGLLYQTSANHDELYFRNYHGECVHYFLNNGQLMITREDPSTNPHTTITNPITPGGLVATSTPNGILITNLKFDVINGSDTTKQPRVTIMMDIETLDAKINRRQKMKIQTTLSSRYYR